MNNNKISFQQYLPAKSLDAVYNHLETRAPRNMEGEIYDNHDEKWLFKIVNGAEAFAIDENPSITKSQIKELHEELIHVWCRDKGFLEPLRRVRLPYAWGKSLAIAHWAMLVISVEQFKMVATVIGKNSADMHSLDSIAKTLTAKIPVDEIKAVLETMVSLGGLEKTADGYKAKKIDYSMDALGKECFELECEAKNYLYKVVTNISKHDILKKGYVEAHISEYRVSKDSEYLNPFFPFSDLFYVFE